MSAADHFKSLMVRVRSGDAQAAADLIRQYESELRVIARVRLTDPGLRRVMDSTDICQSILANFFVRVRAGQFDLDTPEQLLKLLATMIRNKVRNHARRYRTVRRDQRRVIDLQADEVDVAAQQETPSQILAVQELEQACRGRFTADERQVIDLRVDGQSWEEIAEALQGSAEALRKKMARAVNRVMRDVGLVEDLEPE